MKSFVSVTLAILSAFCASRLQAQVETFDLPRLDEIRIDGNFSDWDDGQGFGVEMLLQEEGTFKNAEDHNVHFRAGWNKQGILIHLTVQDDNWVEYREKGKYYSADVVEVFLAGKRGDDDVCQWYITPGMTDEVTEPGVRFRELRRGPTRRQSSCAGDKSLVLRDSDFLKYHKRDMNHGPHRAWGRLYALFCRAILHVFVPEKMS